MEMTDQKSIAVRVRLSVFRRMSSAEDYALCRTADKLQSEACLMSYHIEQRLDELFSPKNSGGMRVFLFAKFYEEVLREYFEKNGYQVLPGKPRIFWSKISFPFNALSDNHRRLINKLKTLRESGSHCTPDGLFVCGRSYFVWEAKNWVQELYPSPFADRVWDFAWLLAKQADYNGHSYDLSGFIISWWERENGMDEALAEVRECVYPLHVELVITKDVLRECIEGQYDWYLSLIDRKRQHIDRFFDVLLGR
jgi:hypothetical protein